MGCSSLPISTLLCSSLLFSALLCSFLPISAHLVSSLSFLQKSREQTRADKSRKEQRRAEKSREEQRRVEGQSREQQRTAENSREQQRTAENSREQQRRAEKAYQDDDGLGLESWRGKAAWEEEGERDRSLASQAHTLGCRARVRNTCLASSWQKEITTLAKEERQQAREDTMWLPDWTYLFSPCPWRPRLCKINNMSSKWEIMKFKKK